MKILQVIHGYPPQYNAGSEVYTQTLCHALADRHEVHVFTRTENPFLPDFGMSQREDLSDPRVKLHVANLARARDRYRQAEVDNLFVQLIDSLRPDVVHIGHLNHLSTSLVLEARKRETPVVFTLHDYWLMCPRGQFIQLSPIDQKDVWALCDGQEDTKCAERCYSRYHSGAGEDQGADVAYWTNWVGRRMAHIRDLCDKVDLFIAPSLYLLERFRDEFGIPGDKLVHLDYGFDLQRLRGRRRTPREPFTFGFMGAHIPAKGLHDLIAAFGTLTGESTLRIWGRNRDVETEGLKALAATLPVDSKRSVEWMGEYPNESITREVFNHCDAIVVPSIWAENSPLVIHEALQARVPVITADYGGMAEYVGHEVNGLLFRHRDPSALAAQMQRLVDNPGLAGRLGERGYLQQEDGNVPSIAQHVATIEDLYRRVISDVSEG